SFLTSSEIYDPATDAVSLGPAMNTPRAAPGLLLPNGKVLIAGGSNAWYDTLGRTELYVPATNSFAKTTPAMRVGRYLPLLPLFKEKFWGVGGYSIVGIGGKYYQDPLRSTELYTP